MLVYLIRHGQTNYNKQKRLQGRTDIELNEYGRELARITGHALSNVTFDHAVSSPLSRAMETAQLIVGSKDIPIINDQRIIEISFGDYEGLCFGEEGYNIPDPDFMNFFRTPEQYKVPPHGESFSEVIERTGEFLQELVTDPDNQDKTILVSTHGCALKSILANINRTSIKNIWGEGVNKNCAVTILEIMNGQIKILEEGKTYY